MGIKEKNNGDKFKPNLPRPTLLCMTLMTLSAM